MKQQNKPEMKKKRNNENILQSQNYPTKYYGFEKDIDTLDY